MIPHAIKMMEAYIKGEEDVQFTIMALFPLLNESMKGLIQIRKKKNTVELFELDSNSNLFNFVYHRDRYNQKIIPKNFNSTTTKNRLVQFLNSYMKNVKNRDEMLCYLSEQCILYFTNPTYLVYLPILVVEETKLVP